MDERFTKSLRFRKSGLPTTETMFFLKQAVKKLLNRVKLVSECLFLFKNKKGVLLTFYNQKKYNNPEHESKSNLDNHRVNVIGSRRGLVFADEFHQQQPPVERGRI